MLGFLFHFLFVFNVLKVICIVTACPHWNCDPQNSIFCVALSSCGPQETSYHQVSFLVSLTLGPSMSSAPWWRAPGSHSSNQQRWCWSLAMSGDLREFQFCLVTNVSCPWLTSPVFLSNGLSCWLQAQHLMWINRLIQRFNHLLQMSWANSYDKPLGLFHSYWLRFSDPDLTNKQGVPVTPRGDNI